MARYRPPDVIVIDLQVSAPSGMETARAIRETCPKTKTVLVSLQDGEEYIEEAMRAGALGFVSSDSAQTDLALAIRAAFEGRIFVSPQVPSRVTQAGIHTE